jgi:excisionase family DNA binding protein
MSDLKCLTTKEVARLCRVSDATVKRWEEAGLLKSERTNGGHRRFRAEEVARFQREQGLGLKQTHGDESVISAIIRRRKKTSTSSLFHSLLAGCEEESADLLIKAHLNGKPLTKIFDDLISPAMRQIGDLWFRGEISVAQEHLATRTAHSAIYKLRNSLPVPQMTGELAFCCAVEGDFHELPTHLAQITIESQGWEVMNFGANTPFYSLAEEILCHSPEAVCISATYLSDLERLSRDYREFYKQMCRLKIPIILGGKVFENLDIRHRFPAQLYAESFTEVAEFIKRIAE